MQPITLDRFEGLYDRGDNDVAEPPHQLLASNLIFRSGHPLRRESFETILEQRIIRVYLYRREGFSDSAIALDTSGNIYHVTKIGTSTPESSIILTIEGMDDFGMAVIYDRAYISPLQSGRGMEEQFVYVYDGNNQARKAAGEIVETLLFSAEEGAAGNCAAGFRRLAIAYESASGHISVPSPSQPISVTTEAKKTIVVTLPDHPEWAVKQHLLVTAVAVGDEQAVENARLLVYYYAPGGRGLDATDRTVNLSYFENELLAEASELFDQLEELPAVTSILAWDNRLILAGRYLEPHVAWISAKARPESINSVNGYIEVRRAEGEGLTNVIAYGRILHAFKSGRSYQIIPNDNPPAFWQVFDLDPSVGAYHNGVAFSLDKKESIEDVYIVSSYRGLLMFNGTNFDVELSFKIRDIWENINRARAPESQVIVDTQSQRIYWLIPWDEGTIPKNRIMVGDYSNGMDPQAIRWSEWFALSQTAANSARLNIACIGIFSRRDEYGLISAAEGDLLASTPSFDLDRVRDEERIIKTDFQTSWIRTPDNRPVTVHEVHITIGKGVRKRTRRGTLRVRLINHDGISQDLGNIDNSAELIHRIPCSFVSDRFSILLSGGDGSNYGIDRITLMYTDTVKSYPVTHGAGESTVADDGDGPTAADEWWGVGEEWWGYNDEYWAV